jgi:Gamma-glutamyltranspeptidase/Carboxypeptidase regulatory-like domain
VKRIAISMYSHRGPLVIGLTLQAGTHLIEQSIFGTIMGVVTDDSEVAVPDAIIAVTNTEEKVTRSFVTDAQGGYEALNLKPGSYKISVQKAGFITVELSGGTLGARQGRLADITLTVAPVTQAVQVTAAAYGVNTENATVSRFEGFSGGDGLPRKLSGRDHEPHEPPGCCGYHARCPTGQQWRAFDQRRKRPLQTMIPGFMKRDHLSVGFGVMGGWNQPQAHLQVISNIVDHGLNIQQAFEASRCVKLTFPGTNVMMESRFSVDMRRGLDQRGHEIDLQGQFSNMVGGGQAVMHNARVRVNYGGSDPRKDGAAVPEPIL